MLVENIMEQIDARIAMTNRHVGGGHDEATAGQHEHALEHMASSEFSVCAITHIFFMQFTHLRQRRQPYKMYIITRNNRR
jgi:hypothetical protein